MGVRASRSKVISRSRVQRAIDKAESLLPGVSVPVGEDPRWQAMLEISYFIESDPAAVWQFIRRWGTHPQADLRMGIACVLLEHLLEHHFDSYFPEVERAAMKSKRFADIFTTCWKFGQSEDPRNARRFDALVKRLRNW